MTIATFDKNCRYTVANPNYSVNTKGAEVMVLPVLLLGHARPDKTRRVLKAIHAASPSALYIAIDGPRDRPGENAANLKTRQVVDEFKWSCPVHKIFYERNYGVKQAIQQSLDKFFDEVEYGVILEDDCLPDQDFFTFAKLTLQRYQGHANVGMISGTNFLGKFPNGKYDAFFGEGHIWGWGTWAEEWQAYRKPPQSYFFGASATKYYGLGAPYRSYLVRKCQDGSIDSWAIPWLLHLANNKKYSVIPVKNTVRNIGHDDSGTHTTGKSIFANVRTSSLSKNLVLPAKVKKNSLYQAIYATLLTSEHLIHRTRRPIAQVYKKAKKGEWRNEKNRA